MTNLRTWPFQRTRDVGSLCLVLSLALVAPITAAKAESIAESAKLGATIPPAAQPSQSTPASASTLVPSPMSIGGVSGIALPPTVVSPPVSASQSATVIKGVSDQSSLNAQINQMQSTLNSMLGNVLGTPVSASQASQSMAGGVASAPPAGQVGGIGQASIAQINQMQSTLNAMLGNALGTPVAASQPSQSMAGSGVSAPPAGQVGGIGQASITQINQMQSTLNAMLGTPVSTSQASQSMAGGVASAPPAGQVGGIGQASISVQLGQIRNTANQMLGNALGTPVPTSQASQSIAGGGASLPPAGQIGGIGQASINTQLGQTANIANQMIGNVLGGSASISRSGAVNASPINLNPSAPAFNGTLLNPAAPRPSLPSDPGSLAIDTAVSVYVKLAGAAGITIPAGAVPVMQDLGKCAVSGASSDTCVGNVVVSSVLKELGTLSPDLANGLTPIENCLAGGGQPKACINPSALPSSVQPLANCILNGGNAGICAENNVVLAALPNGARQVMQTVVSTLSTLEAGAPSLQPPSGLANIVSIASGITSGNWGSVVAGVGQQNAGIAAQAITSAYLPSDLAGTLSPIIAAMIAGNSFQVGFSALSQGDAVGLAEIAFQWYADQYLQAPCAVLPSGGFKDTVCGGAAKAINEVADAAGSVVKDVLGVGKDILQFLGLWNAVDDVASTVWDGVTSVISDIGNFITGKKSHTVECVGWSPPSQYFGNVMASCMPNLTSAAEASGRAPDTSGVYNACVSYYSLCPAYNKQAVASSCQKVASSLGTAAQNASITLNAAAASYTTAGAATFVAQIWTRSLQNHGYDFCSSNFWPVMRQTYAKTCAAALAQYFPGYAAAPSSNSCPVQPASSAMQQACLNAIDSSSGKNVFAGNSGSLYCQKQQQMDKIAPLSVSSASSNVPCQSGNSDPLSLAFTPLSLSDAIPLMTAVWRPVNKGLNGNSSKVATNFMGGRSFIGATTPCGQNNAIKPVASAPFRTAVAWSGILSAGSGTTLNLGDQSILGGMADQIAKAVASLPPSQSDTGTNIGTKKGKKGQPVSGGSVNGPATTKGQPQQASVGGAGKTIPPASSGGGGISSVMDQAQGQAIQGGLAGVAGNAGGASIGGAVQNRPLGLPGGLGQRPAGVVSTTTKGGGINGTVSQQTGAGKPGGGVASNNRPTIPPSKSPPASPSAVDYGACPACGKVAPPEIIK